MGKTPPVDRPWTVLSKSFHVEIARSAIVGTEVRLLSGKVEKKKSGELLSLRPHFTQRKSTEVHWSEGNEVLMIYIIRKSGIFLSYYKKHIYITNQNTFKSTDQLISKLYFQIMHMWPFILPSIKKPQPPKVQHPKQSTFRAILPLFAAVETCRQNLVHCNYQFDETLAPQTDPKKIISQHVGLQMWIDGTWKKRQETSISLAGRRAECCTLYSTGLWETRESLWLAMYFPAKAEYAL